MYNMVLSSLFCLLLAFNDVICQESYESTLHHLVEKLDSAKSKTDYIFLKNAFQRVVQAAPNQWLPLYYEILCGLSWANLESSNEVFDQLIQSALLQLTYLKSLEIPSVEPELLEVRLYQFCLNRDKKYFLKYGPKLFRKVDQLLERAPDNPRVLLLWSESYYYAPIDTQDKLRVNEYIDSALELFKQDTVETIYPSWGYEEALGFKSIITNNPIK